MSARVLRPGDALVVGDAEGILLIINHGEGRVTTRRVKGSVA